MFIIGISVQFRPSCLGILPIIFLGVIPVLVICKGFIVLQISIWILLVSDPSDIHPPSFPLRPRPDEQGEIPHNTPSANKASTITNTEISTRYIKYHIKVEDNNEGEDEPSGVVQPWPVPVRYSQIQSGYKPDADQV